MQLHKLLIKNHHTIAIAESCTGGLLSAALTAIPGSSKYLLLGVVAYSNKAKQNVLKIPKSIIALKGAVSQATAQNMAQSVRRIAKSDYGIGITGIAGPTRGTAQKPVGTVFIATASKYQTICKEFHFSGNRATIRKKSATKALELLKDLIK